MKELKEDIKKGDFRTLYLFHGNEHYLIKHYEEELRRHLVPEGTEAMNLSVFQGKDITADMVINSAETLPFFNDHRLVIAKDTGFFSPGRKEESDKLANYLDDISDTSVLLFIEPDIDKRSSLYKRAAKTGHIVEFKTPTEKDLMDWIVKFCRKQGKTMSTGTAVTLLRTVANDMDNIVSEMHKLIAYKGEQTEITAGDIALVCNQSLEAKIFDLVGAIGNKDTNRALNVFGSLLQMKESPIMVLSMIARQFRLILQCKHLSGKNMSPDQIAESLSLRTFIIRDCLNQAKNFDMRALKRAYESCLITDVKIKTGQMNDRLAVETLILSVG